MRARGDRHTTIGMYGIKRKRLERRVSCYEDGCVGDYVPFYFCPRPVMLYVIHKSKDNSSKLGYTRGQEEIIHLEADLREVVDWAEQQGRRWAFTTTNAASYDARFYNEWEQLANVNWEAVQSPHFIYAWIKRGKQAEFLAHQFFPWRLVRRIGVHNQLIALFVRYVLSDSRHKPDVEIIPDWYY